MDLSNVSTRNKSILALVNKKQKIGIDILASSRHHRKYMKYVSLPWPPLEATPSILIRLVCLKIKL
jgi:hypothetical protein